MGTPAICSASSIARESSPSWRDDLRHQPDAFGADRVHHLTRHRHAAGHRAADYLGESGGHAAARQNANARMGVGEHGAFGGDEEVASQREFEAAGEGRSVDGADDRCAHLGDRGDATLRLELVEVLEAVARCLLEVDARAEGRIGAGEHHRVHGRIVVG